MLYWNQKWKPLSQVDGMLNKNRCCIETDNTQLCWNLSSRWIRTDAVLKQLNHFFILEKSPSWIRTDAVLKQQFKRFCYRCFWLNKNRCCIETAHLFHIETLRHELNKNRCCIETSVFVLRSVRRDTVE